MTVPLDTTWARRVEALFERTISLSHSSIQVHSVHSQTINALVVEALLMRSAYRCTGPQDKMSPPTLPSDSEETRSALVSKRRSPIKTFRRTVLLSPSSSPSTSWVPDHNQQPLCSFRAFPRSKPHKKALPFNTTPDEMTEIIPSRLSPSVWLVYTFCIFSH